MIVERDDRDTEGDGREDDGVGDEENKREEKGRRARPRRWTCHGGNHSVARRPAMSIRTKVALAVDLIPR
jgi:hypothetical protein